MAPITSDEAALLSIVFEWGLYGVFFKLSFHCRGFNAFNFFVCTAIYFSSPSYILNSVMISLRCFCPAFCSYIVHIVSKEAS
jgi:hypothetical protein